MKNIKTIGIIGAGNMGEALIARLRFIKKIVVGDKNKERLNSIKKNYKVDWAIDNRRVTEYSDLIILSVKPKDIDGVLYQIRPYLKEKLLVSIAAGVSTPHLEKILGKIRIVRVMPNLGALVGFGLSAITGGRFAKSEDIKIVKKIFSIVGEVVEVREGLFDLITAISGSGPAYYFLITELLKRSGISLGLKEDLAEMLAISTLYCSGRLVKDIGVSPVELIKKVASKGGTTEAALAVFKRSGLERIILKAVRAARDRARALSR